MARTPSSSDLTRRILRMEEEIRQLRLRNGGAGADDWRDLTPYLGQGTDFAADPDFVTGWSSVSGGLGEDQECPRYYIDRDRVWLAGMIEYDDGGTPNPSDAQYPLRMPVDARPALDNRVLLLPHPVFTLSGTERDFWVGFVVANPGVGGGLLNLQFFGAVDNGTAFILDGISYRLSQ